MIDPSEMDQKAAELGVHTSDMQRDYLFGWLLGGIYSRSELGRQGCSPPGGTLFARLQSASRWHRPGVLLRL